MKTPSILIVISALTFVAGCAHHERYASYDDTISPGTAYGSTTYNSSRTYNNTSTSISPNVGSDVSGSASYSALPGSPDYSASGPSDANLTAQVQQSIYNDNNLVTIAPQIHVLAQPGGMVVLSGKVPNDQQRQTIEMKVKQVAGVVNVRNDIQVGIDPTGRTGHSSRIYSNSISGAQSGVGAAQFDNGGQASGTASSQVAPEQTSRYATSGQVDLQNKSWESKQLRPTSNSSASRQYGNAPTAPEAAAAASHPDQASQGAVENKSLNPATTAPSASGDNLSSTNDQSSAASAAAASSSSQVSKPAAIDAALNSPAAQTPASGQSSQTAVGTLPGATRSGSAAYGADTNSAKGGVSDSTTGTLSGQSSATSATDSSSASATAKEGKGSTTDRSPSSLSGASTGSSSGGQEGASVKVLATSDSDRALGQQITQQLRADSALSASLPMVRIQIENGKATLRGSVKSDDQKKKIESTVQQVTGVSSVENQLRVSATASGTAVP
jgi:osmotically-inducible protein OsmY